MNASEILPSFLERGDPYRVAAIVFRVHCLTSRSRAPVLTTYRLQA